MTESPTYKIALSSYRLAKKIPAGDPFWKPFNASFTNMELTTMDLAAAIYDGHAFTTHHKDHWRSGENYLAGQHIGLDFDTLDIHSTLPFLAKKPFVSKYAALAYTTIRHTPEAPRARVVFLLDTPIMRATNYGLAVASMLWLFGKADQQCRDAVRFFYGSPQCEMEYWDNTLPIQTLKHLIEQYQDTFKRAKKSQGVYRAPPDQAEVQEALKKIPPWGIAYGEWVNVLMGLHSAFGDAGRRLADDWADGTDGEVDHRWKGFKADGNAAGAVTIATVFGIAKRFGWHKAAS